MNVNPLKPPPSLLAKLGSIVIHVEEAMSAKGHKFDIIAVKSLLDDPLLKEWLHAMDTACLLPRKR